MRRRYLAQIAAAFGLCFAAAACAQTDPTRGYPSKPVRVVVGNPLEVGLVEQIMTLRGECVPVQTASAGGEFATVPEASVSTDYKGAHGIALEDASYHPTPNANGHYGRMNIITSGQAPALVMGPCSSGDMLALATSAEDKANWPTMGKYLKKSDSGTIVAMEDVAAPEDEDTPPVMRWVKIGGGGGGGGGGGVITVTVATTSNLTLSGLQTIDGIDLIEDDTVCLLNGSADEGIWKVSVDEWIRIYKFISTATTGILLPNGTLISIHSGYMSPAIFMVSEYSAEVV